MTGTRSAILPREPRGDDRPEPLWLNIGRALSGWESLQVSLAHLFVAATDCNGNYAVLRAFGTQMVVTSKLEMIELAAEIVLFGRPELMKRTRELVNRLRGFNDRRNDIAHGIVREQEEGSGFFLVPSLSTTRKYRETGSTEFPPPAYCWTAAQVERYGESFAQLHMEVIDLRNEIERITPSRPPGGSTNAAG